MKSDTALKTTATTHYFQDAAHKILAKSECTMKHLRSLTCIKYITHCKTALE